MARPGYSSAKTFAGSSLAESCQDRLGLGAEGGQFLDVAAVQFFLIPQPMDRAVVARTGFRVVPQPVMCHGQEEEVEAVELAAAGGQAALQGRDRLGVTARAILADAQGVEVHSLLRGQFDGAAGQSQGTL